MSEWQDSERALAYLARADGIPHRTEGEAALLEGVSPAVGRVLDLGTGDGRLLALVLGRCPQAQGVALDFSTTMIDQARQRFAGQPVEVRAHDLAQPLAELGTFDLVVSSFAIHHLEHARKRVLCEEVWSVLHSGGRFLNLEHVASPTERLHARFLAAMGLRADEEDPSNRLLDVETQLAWLRQIGFVDVDCLWKWRELALLAGEKPR